MSCVLKIFCPLQNYSTFTLFQYFLVQNLWKTCEYFKILVDKSFCNLSSLSHLDPIIFPFRTENILKFSKIQICNIGQD